MFKNIINAFVLCNTLETTFSSTLRCVFMHKRKGLPVALLPKLIGKPIDAISIPLMKRKFMGHSQNYSITKEGYFYELKTTLHWDNRWNRYYTVDGFSLQTPHGMHRSLLRTLKKYASKHHLDISIRRVSDDEIDISGHVTPLKNTVPVFSVDESLLEKCY